MEKNVIEALEIGTAELGLTLRSGEAERLAKLVQMLLEWNRKLNLTSLTDPLEVVEKHVLDSLVAARFLPEAGTVMDLGAGGGFPGLPLAIVRPALRFTLVESILKKVGFLKAAMAALGLSNARAIQVRAEGRLEREGLSPANVAISRAFMPPEEWLAFAPSYVEVGGRVIAMVGPEVATPEATEALALRDRFEYRLPRSGARRVLALYEKSR